VVSLKVIGLKTNKQTTENKGSYYCETCKTVYCVTFMSEFPSSQGNNRKKKIV
jgi:hypothetical protein